MASKLKFPRALYETDHAVLQFWSDAPKPRRTRIKKGLWDPRTGRARFKLFFPYLYDPKWPTDARRVAWYIDDNGQMFLVGFVKDEAVVVRREGDVVCVESW